MRTRLSLLIGLLAGGPSGLLPDRVRAAELHGHVIDRGTLRPDGTAKGVAGVQVSVYDGTKKIGGAVTNARGLYRIRKVSVPEIKVVYLARGRQPEQTARLYRLAPGDTASRDVYVDAAPLEKPAKAKGGKGDSPAKPTGYYPGLAKGFVAIARLEPFFRENAEDSLADLSSFFDGRDTSAGYVGAMCELFWAEFLSQDRTLESRYYLAAALMPLLDSLGWGKLQGMKRYLEIPPETVREVSAAMREAIRVPKRLPGPKEIRKSKAPPELASQIAAELLADPGLSEKAKDRFLAQWKKAWGKEAPSYREDGEEAAFRPNARMARVAEAHRQSAAAHYLKGRGLYAIRDFAGAVDALEEANKLAGSYPPAKYLEASALMRLGRDPEALGRFQALREAPDPHWKAMGFYGLGVLAEKDGRHSEAAGALWKSVRHEPSPEAVDLLSSVSLKLNDRAEIEKLLQERAAQGDSRAHYWLGRYGEADQQVGVALDHYKKAWEAAPSPEYAEALARLSIAQDEFGPALALLEPLRSHLTPAGRLALAECLLQAGRSLDASREFKAGFESSPTPEILARYVEALVRANRAPEALAVARAFPDQGSPKVRFALAKAQIGNHHPDLARPILEALAKQEENNADYHHYLGLCYYEDRNWQKAKREFDEALKYRQDHLEALYYTGLCGVKLGRADAARNYFNELAQRSSPEWKAKGLLGVGISFAAEGKPEAAENFYARSFETVETAEAAALLALSKRRLGAPEKWVPMAQKAYALDNREPKAVVAMGEGLIASGRKREALKHYQEALADNPNSCELLAGMAQAQNLAGDYASGKKSSGKAISLCPQEPQPYFSAGIASDKSGNRDEARDFFKAYRKAGGDVALLPEDYR